MQTANQSLELVKDDREVLETYVEMAPLPLAIERIYECNILAQQVWRRPCLDVGCGDGIFAHILFRDKIDVGIDINSIEVERARKLNAYNQLIVGSAAKLPFDSGHFKTIFSNSVFEHIPNIEEVLKEVTRVLAEDGSLYLTLPTDYFDYHTVAHKSIRLLSVPLAERFRAFFNRFWNHHHYHSRDGWEQLFNRCGLKVAHSITYDSAWACHLNNFLTPFSVPAAVWRKYLKRWFISPGLRKAITPFLSTLVRVTMDPLDRVPQKTDGLIFFHLKKR